MITRLVHQKDCRGDRIVTDIHTGEIACSGCGAVSPERAVDSGSETAGLTGEEYQNSARSGMRISLKMADMGLSTVIESQDRDSAGRFLSSENRRMFYRLRMWDRNSRSAASTRSYHKAFTMLDGLGAKLGLPEAVIEQTAYLFRKIAAKKILAGRSTQGTLCAAAYIACRLTGTPRTLQDIASAGDIKKKSLQRIYRFLARELDIRAEAFAPAEFIARITRGASVSEKAERLAFGILDVAARNGVSTSKNPVAMAAAAVYLACTITGEGASQMSISRASGISAVTIRDRTREIRSAGGGLLG